MEGSGDRGDDTEKDAEVGDVDLGGDTGVEAAEDGKAGDEDQLCGRLAEEDIGKEHCEWENQPACNLNTMEEKVESMQQREGEKRMCKRKQG